MSNPEIIPSQFPYQRLGFDDDDHIRRHTAFRGVRSRRSWYSFKRVHIRKRFKIKVPSLRKFLRRKVRLVSAVKRSYAKALKRFKEGQSHFGDLFAGNYMFVQVNPASFMSIDQKLREKIHGLPSRYSIQRVA